MSRGARTRSLHSGKSRSRPADQPRWPVGERDRATLARRGSPPPRQGAGRPRMSRRVRLHPAAQHDTQSSPGHVEQRCRKHWPCSASRRRSSASSRWGSH